jgi:alcohol dehydrogenase (NADP+)
MGTQPLSLNGSTLVSQRRVITGSLIGVSETREMLGFCAKHHLSAEIEVIPAGKINEAYERVLASGVRYRFVIDNATLA